MAGSIRRRLIFLVLASIALVWSVVLVSSYRQATREVDEWENARLAETAQMLALLDQNDLAVLARTHIDAREEQQSNDDSDDDDDALPRDLVFQVRDASGHLIAGSADPVPPHAWDLPSASADGAHTITLGGQMWHTFTLHGAANGRSVRVLEPANTRSDLTSGVARRIARPVALALPVLALLVWFSVGHSLAALKTLSAEIRAHDINRLEPIDMGRTPSEVRPLVDAINHVLSRLHHSRERERAFTADAAHELRTPLAAIKVQAQVALVEHDVALQRLAMQRVVQGVDRSAHLAAQLLLLARLDEHDTLTTSPVRLDQLAGEAVLASEERTHAKGISIEYDNDIRAAIIAEPVLIGTLLDNLIDNAIKYGDAGGRIEVMLRNEPGKVLLTVRDDGPGDAPADLAHLTQRFFRVAGARSTGSGLGLSIVARIAEYFDAQLAFGPGIEGRGLAVSIAFPAAAIAIAEPAQATTVV
jgi:two-component system, OmpR family, sensor histidine kinase QseC